MLRVMCIECIKWDRTPRTHFHLGSVTRPAHPRAGEEEAPDVAPVPLPVGSSSRHDGWCVRVVARLQQRRAASAGREGIHHVANALHPFALVAATDNADLGVTDLDAGQGAGLASCSAFDRGGAAQHHLTVLGQN